MTEFLQFLILGLGTGGLYALLGIGVVVIYRGSGVLNFAHGAIALFGLAAFYETRDAMGTVAAIAVAAVLSALLGVIIQVAIMRPMRNASALVRVICTLALMTAIQQGAIIRYGHEGRSIHAILPSDPWKFLGITVPKDRLYILLITVVIAALLAAVYRYTRFGMATAAVAENHRATAALGWSPDRVAVGNWMVGGALAGLSGCLIGPIANLDPATLSLAIVPALAAGLVGGFSSFGLTLVGGLLIGSLEAETTRYITAPGWSNAVPFIVIIALLVFRGKALPLRSERSERLPTLGTGSIPRVGLVIAVGLTMLSMSLFDTSWIESITSGAVIGLVCLSVVVLTGYCGQLSLAQYALAGVGALAAARFADATNMPFLIALPVGVVASVATGVIIALPAVRVRGVNLAVVTLGIAVVISSVVLANQDLTGGSLGTIVEDPSLFGLSLSSYEYPARWASVVLLLFTGCGLLTANLRRGRSGRRLIAVRNNERAAASVGISVAGAKLYAFGLSAAFAGLAGVLIAFRNPNVVFEGYEPLASISAVLFAVLGGVGFIVGAVVAGLSTAGGPIYQVITHFVSTGDWYLFVVALLLIATVIANPNGIAFDVARLGRMLVNRARPAVPRWLSCPPTRGWVVAEVKAQNRVAPLTLEVKDLSVSFGGVKALQSVSMRVEPGQIVGVIGPNGAGKTTLVDALAGFHRHYSGHVRLGGVSIDGLNASKRVRAGMTRSFQSLELFDDLTVADNLRAASDSRDRLAYLSDLVRPGRPVLQPAAAMAVTEFGLEGVLDRLPHQLPYAQRRLVAIARAVAASPSILMLDEPASGLDQHSTAELAHLLRRLATSMGIGIVLIEHDMSLVMDVCDWIEVLNFGQTLASGTAETVRNDPAVISAYLGESEDAVEQDQPLDFDLAERQS